MSRTAKRSSESPYYINTFDFQRQGQPSEHVFDAGWCTVTSTSTVTFLYVSAFNLKPGTLFLRTHTTHKSAPFPLPTKNSRTAKIVSGSLFLACMQRAQRAQHERLQSISTSSDAGLPITPSQIVVDSPPIVNRQSGIVPNIRKLRAQMCLPLHNVPRLCIGWKWKWTKKGKSKFQLKRSDSSCSYSGIVPTQISSRQCACRTQVKIMWMQNVGED